jgi:hypothetical protein
VQKVVKQCLKERQDIVLAEPMVLSKFPLEEDGGVVYIPLYALEWLIAEYGLQS